MSHIVLTEEQVKVVTASGEPVQVRDGNGIVLGFSSPLWTEKALLEAQKTLSDQGPWYTTEQVLAHLNSLEPK